MGLWTSDIPNIVFARVTEDFSEELKEKYEFEMTKVKYPFMEEAQVSWNKFSTSQVSDTPPEFPYITIIELPGQERGQTLDGNSLNAALFTFQVDVFDNQSEARAGECMDEVTRVMKTMRFDINSMPYPNNSQQEYRKTARFSRIIGFNDIL